MRSSKPPYATPDLAICRFIPPSFQGIFNVCTPPAAIASTEILLHALQSSVAAHLGTSFCYAELILHDPSQGDGYQRDGVQESLKRIGLRQAMKGVPALPASSLAVHANIQFPIPRTDIPQAALSIEFSRWGMSTAVFCVDELVLEEQRHKTIAFSDEKNASGADDSPEEDAARLAEASEALRRISTPPLGSCSGVGDMLDEIQVLILHGDSVRDAGFVELLIDLFGSRLVEEAYDFDPIFAPAVAGARASHENMDLINFEEPAAFGCRWMSKLYRDRNQEL
ncbi:hypothetical protein BDP81DRAFT_170708 [Colletotrichum phormii]|uniref:Uncharacterized protein n=1 Tax=Colletotrichum phormii TaxID=359342 RepID=A0AAI9ZC34_9PEZI|nr:uncharacterized protein BDP81DRAFT_170708 [Colletotrichum phormii]KAK1621784.1 hypothetical protein BDP81DRAFT_170708 [Colletotrichum phormii]